MSADPWVSDSAPGYFGDFGGRYVPEVLVPALDELQHAYQDAKADPEFAAEFAHLLATFAGRPTPLTFAGRLTERLGGARIYLKNEGVNITGAHKITHCLGQALLAKRMGRTRLVAETGAGQHGLATATVAAKFGFECTVYMGEVDIARQRPNVFMMERLGATVVPVRYGSRTLKDAVNAALKDYIASSADTHYLLGSALGPHPYPTMVRDFQSVVGQEIMAQLRQAEGRLPDYVVACVGGGSNAIGAFNPFVPHESVALVGVEAGGKGDGTGEHAQRFPHGRTGIVEGYKSVFLQDDDGQLSPTHSISAGLDYPGIGPELAWLHDRGRISFASARDDAVIEAVDLLARTEGILPALESAHAVAHVIDLAPRLGRDEIVVINISGRGDKDLFILADAFADQEFYAFLRTEAARHGQQD
ncbi:tryptophan synthase subunit beta [Pseudofrankia saprophytica]|uniref:tryptophan synthase subunit beta n=1 Tax=Pseudofrankia saprophytica TaxID=298655 RepID=UPI000234D04D|nr:tryptophan synthase subunit beta [Pseudofrankia saprophytica]